MALPIRCKILSVPPPDHSAWSTEPRPPPTGASAVIPSGRGTDVVTIAAATTHELITLQSPGHRIQDVQAFAAPPATGVNLPLGLVGFKVLDVTPGGSATVNMILPQDVHVN